MGLIERLAEQGTTLILVTHHLEEIPPIVDRVVLLQKGQVAIDGSKTSVLTAKHLSAVFGAPVDVDVSGGHYYLRPLTHASGSHLGN